ncbi:D-Ala-D-Ala carboxypeptidase family metallohydrolase [Delftia sp. UME58]|uniref:D-Ala-D-Ala carboxypeptidase family metallohydrolase n=1 Tax=Delftia sp. UME58 TaxID=1862322 RepID=UPI001601CFF2|nr:D-Ala-D-Ala carboxypeptidase family metallohydrolase [Delftia sp. UME58]MBB1649833.1 peptidase M15A [Delftia sp. UME58]
MQLTPHFSLTEMTASSTAQRQGLDNTPTPEALQRLALTAAMLERVRAHLGVPIIVTSGYRSRAVNAAVGGVTSSDHAIGAAADIVAPQFGMPYAVAKALAPHVNALGIGQIIYESVGGKHWVHLSTRTPDKPVNRVITVSGKNTLVGVQEV